MQGRVALEEWLLEIESDRLADEGLLQWTRDFIVRGPARLPVEVMAA
jgi:cytochrome P450